MFKVKIHILPVAVCFVFTTAADQAATLIGHVVLKSRPHPAHAINTAADQYRNKVHKTDKLMTEDQMVNANGTMGK